MVGAWRSPAAVALGHGLREIPHLLQIDREAVRRGLGAGAAPG